MLFFRRLQLPVFAVLMLTLMAGCGKNLVPASISLESSAQTVTEASTLTLTATAEGSALVKVAFYDGATKLGEDETAPYSFDVVLTSAENGEHTYRSVAMDGVNNSLAVSERKVQVNIAQSKTNPSVPIKILSISPADGATGVKSDTRIVVTFSGPADKAAVEASYQSDSEGLKPDQITFTWNPASTVLTIIPKEPLVYAEVTIHSLENRFQEVIDNTLPKQYTLKVFNQTLIFSTAKQVVQEWLWRDSEVMQKTGTTYAYAKDCSRYASNYLCAGDTDNNEPVRSAISFDLTYLPKNAQIQSSNLVLVRNWRDYQVPTDLFSCLGPFSYENCRTLIVEDIPVAVKRTVGEGASVNWRELWEAVPAKEVAHTVSSKVNPSDPGKNSFPVDLAGRTVVTFRFRLDKDTNNNNSQDLALIVIDQTAGPYLELAYLVP